MKNHKTRSLESIQKTLGAKDESSKEVRETQNKIMTCKVGNPLSWKLNPREGFWRLLYLHFLFEKREGNDEQLLCLFWEMHL